MSFISIRQRSQHLARRFLPYSSSTKLSAMHVSWSGSCKMLLHVVALVFTTFNICCSMWLQNFLLNLVRKLKICLLLYFNLAKLRLFSGVMFLTIVINTMAGTFDYLSITVECLLAEKQNGYLYAGIGIWCWMWWTCCLIVRRRARLNLSRVTARPLMSWLI